MATTKAKTENKTPKKAAAKNKVVKTTPKEEASTSVSKNRKVPLKKNLKPKDFSIIKTGGKQYKVASGDTIKIEMIPGLKVGDKVVFDEVLLLVEGDKSTIGVPTVSGVKVEGEVVEEGRDKKVSVIRFKSKSRYFKNRGHRQPYIKVKIK